MERDDAIDADEARLQHIVFKREHWECQLCGAKDSWLELYIIGWQIGEQVTDFGPDDLLALCSTCFDKGEPF